MRKAFILFLLVLIAGAFVSCDLDELFYHEEAETPESYEDGDLTVYNSLPEDTKAAVDKIGEIYSMYALDVDRDVARFFNGQEITDRFRDEDGNPTPLVFNSWLIAYKSLFGWVPEIFENAPKNAMLHNGQGLDLKKLPKGLRYVQYCEFRYLETNEFHNAGDLCFITIRLADEILSESWYAKSLSFDPTLCYEISTFGINILTGEHVSYDYNKHTVGPAKNIKYYDEEGMLIQNTYLNDAGEISHWFTFSYNQDGNKTVTCHYDALGVKTNEAHYFGTFRNNEVDYVLAFDESENLIWKQVYEYDSAWNKTKVITYDSSNSLISETSFNVITGKTIVEKHYIEEVLSYKYDYNQNGKFIKETGYYPSGSIMYESYYDETSGELINQIEYSEAEVVNLEIESLDGSYEIEHPVSFATNDVLSFFIPISFDVKIDSSNILVEVSVVDNDGNEIELDSTEYSFRYSGVSAPIVHSGENSIEEWPVAHGNLESISVILTNDDNISGKLRIRLTEGAMLVNTADVFTKTIAANTSGLVEKDFILDFETYDPIELNNNDLFWYAVSAEGYDANISLLYVLGGLEDLIEKTGADAGTYGDTWFWPNSAGTELDLSVALSGEGTANSDREVYFIFAQYIGGGTADFSAVLCQDETKLRELGKVKLLFHVD